MRNLTKHTADSFEATKQLRSGRHSDLELYAIQAIRRMAANLEEPGRTKALQITHTPMQYRILTPPRTNLPPHHPLLGP